MLAQNFMKPEALGISEAEIAALISVLGMMEREEIEVDMREWGHPCGTVHCIGGWARAISSQDHFHSARRPKNLEALFYPSCFVVNGKLVNGFIATRRQAAIALRNYLTTGEPRWPEALAS